MATPKFTKRTMNINDLTVDLDLNVRLHDQYDIPQMVESIISGGRILNPISVEKKTDPTTKEVTYRVLRGNRRTLGGQFIMNDPQAPADVKEQLKKVEVCVYENLSEPERMALVVDHDQKGLSRTELVLTIWRLAKAMFTEKEIIAMLYFLLAKYTGNEKNLATLPASGPDRVKKLGTWFHGTVGNFIMGVQRMPSFVRDAFILTHKVQDGIVKAEDAKLPVKVNQTRVSALSKCKTEDSKAGKWDDETGGPTFNETWEKFRKEDAGLLEKERKVRPSVEDIERTISIYSSEIAKKALRASLGDKQMDLADLDERTHKESSVFKVLWEVSGNGGVKPEVADLVKAMLGGDLNNVKALVSK